MGWVWVWDWHVEVTEPRVTPLVNQTVSVTQSKLPQRANLLNLVCVIKSNIKVV